MKLRMTALTVLSLLALGQVQAAEVRGFDPIGPDTFSRLGL